MVATTSDVNSIVNSLVRDLAPRIRVSKLILFGSYVNGQPKKWSDLDIAIISPNFSGVPMWRRQELLAEALPDVDVRLSPIAYAPEELREPTLFLREILATGRVVYEAPAE